MQESEQILKLLEEQLQVLLESPASYMRDLSRMSQKVVSLDIKYIFYTINKICKLICDSQQPIKKKFLAVRMIKDTLMLGSHSFYILTIIKLVPFVIGVLSQGDKKADNGLQYLIKIIGSRAQVSNAIQVKTVSIALLQLLNEMMKWLGTNIGLHPYYSIPFSSVYKGYLGSFNKIKAMNMADLTYYTTDATAIYEQNYVQNELCSDQWCRKQIQFVQTLVNGWISLPSDDPDKGMSLKLLENMVETGDSLYIRHIVDCLKPLIQSPITGYQAIQVVHELLKVKQIQFYSLARDQLLYFIAYYILMMNTQQFSQLQKINLSDILKHVFVWKTYSLKLGLKTQIYEQFFIKMKNQWIFVSDSQYSTNNEKIQEGFYKYNYLLSSDQVSNINRQKRSHLNLKDDSGVLNKIRNLEYQKRQQNSKNNSSFKGQVNHSRQNIRNISQSQGFQNYIGRKNKLAPQVKQERISLHNIGSQSPIQQVNFNKIGKSLSELRNGMDDQNSKYIKFNNSLNHLSQLSQHKSKQVVQKQKNNIYTSNQFGKDKNSLLSRSGRSNISSKKSLNKIQKVSSLGFGLQRVKSSKLISHCAQDQRKASQAQRRSHNINQVKSINIIKFDQESQYQKAPQISSSNLYKLSQNDNRPYKGQGSHQKYISKKQLSNGNNLQRLSQSKKSIKSQQMIVVEETIKKPKFAFSKIQDQDSLTQSNQNKQIKVAKNPNIYTEYLLGSEASLQSAKVDPTLFSEDKVSKYSSIPSDFNQVLNQKKRKSKYGQQCSQENQSASGVRLNKFPYKLKQLQLQIKKTKQFQFLYQQKMKQKDDEYENLLKNQLPTNDHIYLENQKLKNQLQQRQKIGSEKLARKQEKFMNSPRNKVSMSQQIPFITSKIFQLGKIEPFQPSFIKQLISNKCLLSKNQIFELGYSFKNQENHLTKTLAYSICLYFKFKVKCQICSFKVISQSLIFREMFQAKIVNVVGNKQLKFEQKIIGYCLFNECFEIPQIQLQVRPQKGILDQLNQKRSEVQKLKQNYQIKLPCCLFNFIGFHSPNKRIQTIQTKYAVKSRFSVQQYSASLKGQYLLNSFKCGKWSQSTQKSSGFYVSFHTYIKNIKSKQDSTPQQNKVYFDELANLQRKQINLFIRKLNGLMFYIQSDNSFEEDRVVLIEISKILAR